jgi:hypothetical protein
MEGERPYLREAGFQEYKESVRSISFEELRERVSNAEEMMAMIEERERQADGLVGREFEIPAGPGTRFVIGAEGRPEQETREADEAEPQKAEVAILERLPAAHSGYDFYIARRQRKGHVFRPETVIVAKTRDKVYLATYAGEEAGTFEAIDENRFLKEMVNPKSFAGQPGRSLATLDRLAELGLSNPGGSIGGGGEGEIYPIMYRRQEEMLPKAGVRKESRHEVPWTEEAEAVTALGDLLSKHADQPGAEYFVQPIGEADVDGKRNTLYEMAETKEGVANNLAEEIESSAHELSADQRLTIVRQLFQALKFLNDRGFRHNDIKPRNILLTRHGIKVCDYGLMTFRQEDVKEECRQQTTRLPREINTEVYERIGFMIGTIPYVSPEVGAEDDRFRYENTDTFGAAVTAYSVLSGEDPREAIPGGNAMIGFMGGFENFKEALFQKLDGALAGQDFQGLDQGRLRDLAELIKAGVSGTRETPFPSPDAYIEALRDLGVSETLDIEPEAEPEPAPDNPIDPEADTAELAVPTPDSDTE